MCIRDRPLARALVALAEEREESGDREGALAAYRRALGVAPEGSALQMEVEVILAGREEPEKLSPPGSAEGEKSSERREREERGIHWWRKVPGWAWALGVLGVLASMVSGVIMLMAMYKGVKSVTIEAGNTPAATGIVTRVTEASYQTPTPTYTPRPTPVPLPPSPAFDTLPQPLDTLDVNGRTWEIFSDGNYVSGLTMRDGILWAATGGGVVAWDPGSGHYKKYTVFDGLATNGVWSIATSSDGRLWVGSSESGISCFDGEEWKQVESPGLDVVLAATSDGSLWASDGYGDLVGQLKDGIWRTYTTDDGLPSTRVVRAVTAPDGSLWVTTEGQRVSRFNGDSWYTYSTADGLPRDEVEVLDISPDGTVWLLSEDGISRFDGTKSTLIVSAENLPYTYGGWWEVIDAAVAPDGALWFAVYDWESRTGHGVQRLFEHMLASFSISDGLPSNKVSAIYVEPDGTVWIGTDQGVAQYDGESWRTYVTDDPTMGIEVRSIDFAPDGAIWFTSWGGGASRFDGEEWQTYTEHEGLPDNFLWDGAIAADGTAWFGTWVSGMVVKFDGRTWHSYGSSDGLDTGGYVWAVTTAPDGSVWAGTDNGVAHFDGQVWQMYRPIDGGIALSDVRSIAVSQDGTVWIGTYDYEYGGRVARFDHGSWQVYGQEEGLTADDAVFALAVTSDDTVLAGTYTGLFEFDGSNWRLIPGSPTHINDIAVAPDDSVWVATEFDGISHYDGSAWQENYRPGEGLPGLRMHTVAIGPDGSVWAGGVGGVVRIRSSRQVTPVPMASITLVNNSDETICYVYISPVESAEWGEDQLSPTEVIEPSRQRVFEVDPGTYDLMAADCDGNEVSTVWGVNLTSSYTWYARPIP